MDIKSEKRKSFWGGILAGAGAAAVILTIVACILLWSQASFYSKLVADKQQNPAGSGGGLFQFTNPASSAVAGQVINSDVVKKVDDIYTMIDELFYFEDQVDTDKMRDKIYAAVMDSLDDPYSVYYTEEEFAALFEDSEGVYYGIGSYVTMDEVTNLPMLSGVFPGSPAQDAGLRDGDFIYEVDGASVAGLSLTEVTDLIKGPKGTDVVLTIIRDGETDYLYVTVTRDEIETPTVTHEMYDNNIGYLQITEFDDVTVSQFEEAYADLQSQGMKGMILDLRSNPGGNLDTVVSICEDILPAGIITYTVDKNGKREEYKGKGKTPIDIPLVVLVNGYSASASELMTGAIRDYGVGTIMGTNTFGKGIVQNILSLGDGTGIKITTSSYFTPNGECIHKKGIAPDIEVEFDSELYYSDEAIDNQLEEAKKYLLDKIG